MVNDFWSPSRLPTFLRRSADGPYPPLTRLGPRADDWWRQTEILHDVEVHRIVEPQLMLSDAGIADRHFDCVDEQIHHEELDRTQLPVLHQDKTEDLLRPEEEIEFINPTIFLEPNLVEERLAQELVIEHEPGRSSPHVLAVPHLGRRLNFCQHSKPRWPGNWPRPTYHRIN